LSLGGATVGAAAIAELMAISNSPAAYREWIMSTLLICA
jgi:hypothetical protein